MYCVKCGNQVDENTEFCPACGESTELSGNTHGPYEGAFVTPAGAGGALALGIVTTILCCWPLGVVSIVYAAIAFGKNSSRDFDEAHEAVRKSKMWSYFSIGIGVLALLIYLVLVIFVGVSSTP